VWDNHVKKYASRLVLSFGLLFYLASQTNIGTQATSALPDSNTTPSTEPSIESSDSSSDCDFSKYTPAVIRSIRRHWRPLATDRTKRVVVTFDIASDGSLLNTTVREGSDSPSADEAALAAVQRSAPFKMFPVTCKAKSISLEFTFGYQSVGGINSPKR